MQVSDDTKSLPSLMEPPAPPSTVVLSIVTVFWNGADDLERYFAAIERSQRRLPFSIEAIAIDNDSSDGTAEIIEREYPWVRLVRNDENLGFAPACNQGLELAQGRAILLLNPDCEADAEALSGMFRFLDREESVGAVGCLLLHGDGLPQDSYHHEPGFRSYWATHSMLSPVMLKIRKLGFRVLGQSWRARKVDWVMGAAMMVPRSVYEQVGGMDPEYFMYSEDADWCRRIRESGFNVAHLPRYRIIHHHGTSAARRPEFTFRRLFRSLLMYSNKHHTPNKAFTLRLAVSLDMIMRLPAYTLTGNFARMGSALKVARAFIKSDPNILAD